MYPNPCYKEVSYTASTILFKLIDFEVAFYFLSQLAYIFSLKIYPLDEP